MPAHRKCAGIVAACAVASAHADPPGLADRKFEISLGAFLNQPGTDIRADGDVREGTPVDWGSTFGEEQASRFRLDGLWRFRPHHHLRLMYTNYSRSRGSTLREDIEWNGHRLPQGSSAEGTLRFEIVEVAYEYDFARSDNRDLVLSVGIHGAAFDAKISGIEAAPGADVVRSIESDVSVDAPLPVLGVRGMWHLGANFYLNAQVQYFSLTRGRYDGSLVNYGGMLIWQPGRMGVGVGYDHFVLHVDADSNSYRGRLDWRYRGPQLFVSLAF